MLIVESVRSVSRTGAFFCGIPIMVWTLLWHVLVDDGGCTDIFAMAFGTVDKIAVCNFLTGIFDALFIGTIVAGDLFLFSIFLSGTPRLSEPNN